MLGDTAHPRPLTHRTGVTYDLYHPPRPFRPKPVKTVDAGTPDDPLSHAISAGQLERQVHMQLRHQRAASDLRRAHPIVTDAAPSPTPSQQQ